MMKLKHLLALAAVAVGSSAWSQDFTSGSTYYFQNVETGSFISSGSTWGTKATMSPVMDIATSLEADGSNWKIKTQGTQYLGKDAFVDQTSVSWIIEPVAGEDHTYTISNDGKYLGNSDYLISKDLTEVNNATKWIIKSVTEYEADMEEASASNPVNCSFYIKAPNASYINNPSYNGTWSGVSGSVERRTDLNTGQRQNWTALSPYTMQIYNGTGTTSQSVTVSKAGLYAVGVYGFYRATARDKSEAYLYAGDEKVMLKFIDDDALASSKFGCTSARNGKYVPNTNSGAGEAFAHGLYKNVLLVRVEDPSTPITIGIKKEKTEGSDWTCWDNFFLEYYGDVSVAEVQLAEFVNAYNDAMDAVTAIDVALLSSADQTELTAIINNNTVELATATKEQLVTATDNLNAAAKAYRYKVKVAELVAQGPGTDLTSLIVNPSFEDSFTGWVNTGSMAIQGNTSIAKDGNSYAEFWQPNGTKGVEQTIKNLPAGVYRLTVRARTRGTSSASIYIDGRNTNLAIDDSEKDYVVDALITETSDVKIGLTADGTGAAGSWIACDNFRLTYVGSSLPELPALAEGAMNKDVEAAQTAAVDAYNADKTIENYDAAVEAINAAKASVEQYKNNAVALAAQKALVDGTNIYGEGYDAYAAAYAEKQAAYDNRTLNEVVVNPNAATGWQASTEYNFLLTPWTIGGKACNNFDTALYVNTWSVEGETDGSNFTVPFFEYWVGSGSLDANAIETNISDVENGLYVVSALVRTSHNGDLKPINLTVNNGEAVDVTAGDVIEGTNRYLNTFTAQGLVKDGVLRIKFDVPAESNVSWLSFKNVTYKKERDLNPDELLEWATPDEIAALNAAIEAAEANTLGFQKGEFAPYNNIEAIKTLAAAKAITEPAEKSVVADAQKALEEAVWTENTEEVNAVYDGQFTLTTAQEGGHLVPTGWTNLGYNTRVYNQTNKGTNAGVGDEAGCLFAKYETSYGTVEGYTMPLKAGVYSLKFNYGGWNELGARNIVVKSGDNTATVDPAKVTAPDNKAHTQTSSWAAYDGTITIPADGNYVLEFAKTTDKQNQIAIADIRLFSIPASELAKIELEKAINGVNVPTANVGEGAFLYPAAAIAEINNKIEAAKSVLENATSAEEIEAQVEIVNAIEIPALKAPAAGQKFNLILTYSGWTYDNKAITYLANDRNDMGKYNIQYLAEANANYAQAFTMTNVEGNKYKMSQLDNDGNERYISTGVPYDGGNTSQIRTTINADDALVVEVIPTATEGVYNIKNTAANQYIGSQDAGIFTVNSHIDFKISEAQEATATLAISDAKYGTFIAPFDAKIPTGVTVYTCEKIKDNTLNLVEANAIKANTAYIVYAEEPVNKTLSGWGLATKDAYETGVLTGSYELASVEVGKYLLQNNGNVGFYLVAEEGFKIGANRCYLTAPVAADGETKAFYLDNATAIEAINALAAGNVKAIYNAAGAAQKNLVRGLNIVKTADGKTVKVMVK